MKISSLKYNVLFHLIVVSIFLVVPFLLAPRPPGVAVFNVTPPGLRDLMASCLMIGFAYLNFFLLVPRFLLERKYLLYILIFCASLLIIIFLPSVLTGNNFFENLPAPESSGLPSESDLSQFIFSINHNILLFFTVVAFSTYLRIQEQLFKVEKAKNQMEIQSLKEQINPHFLFNVLNNIYGQAIEDDSPKTASSILKLSSLLRHVVHGTEQSWVPLKKELRYLEDYISLQKERLSKENELNYTVSGTFKESLKIAPLILIPFIENAFKHGINPDTYSRIDIEIEIQDQLFFLSVRNKKMKYHLEEHEKSGAGLKITLNRLAMLYPNKHQLHIEEENEDYKVELKLELND